jgi:hypothetical protein
MLGKRKQQQRSYLPLKRSSPRPQFYRNNFQITIGKAPQNREGKVKREE